MNGRTEPKQRAPFRFALAATATLMAFALVHFASAPASAFQDKGPKGGPSPAPGKPGLNLNTDKAFKGYTLFSPNSSKSTYLIDMEGRLVKTWDSPGTAGAYGHLLPNGNLLRAIAYAEGGKAAGGGGAGGRIVEINWKGEVVWDWKCPPGKRQHHDVIMLPNGNVMMQVWDVRSAQDCAEAGRRGGGGMQLDSIIEVRKTGKTTGEIVWEWNLFDHLIQDFDKAKKNFGDVAAHPELVDINYGAPKAAKADDKQKDKGGDKQKDKVDDKQKDKGGDKQKDKGGDKQKDKGGKGGGGGGEFTHVNGISYHPELDQIAMSVHKLSEIWIIDHSTSKAEAAGHTGGRSGKGGDLLFRWGNPQVYRAGKTADRQLFSQHNAHWIPKGLPGEGHLLVFNNGSGRPGGQYSSVDEIIPPVDAQGRYTLKAGTAFAPAKAVWSYTAPNKSDFYSNYISGAQRLPNGNTLICSGANGTFFEVTAEKEVVWKYVNPAPGKGGAAKGGMGGGGGDTFRALRYTADYPGLTGKELKPGKTLEELLKKDGKK